MIVDIRTLSLYCKDDPSLIENYEQAINDKTQTWHCHHRREKDYSRDELIARNEYYHRPADELIFLTPIAHAEFHQDDHKGWEKGHEPWNKGSKDLYSDEYIKKLSIAHTGKKLGPCSESRKRKIGLAHSKPVVQYDMNNNFIAEFESARAAALTICGTIEKSCHITSCCRNNRKSAYGFVWRYKSSETVPRNTA